MAKYYLLPKRLAKRFPWARHPAWFAEWVITVGIMKIASLFRFPVAVRFLSRLFGMIGYGNGQKRRIVRRNLQFIMPDVSEEELDQSVRVVFSNVGVAAAELLFLERIWQQRENLLEFCIHPESMEIIKQGNPAVFATAHVGAWQLTNLVNRKFKLCNSTLYQEDANPWMRRFFLKQRQSFGARLIPVSGGARQLLRELGQGNSVAGAFDTRPEHGPMLPLFGVPAPLNVIPAKLSLRGNYPLIPLRCLRLPGMRYRIEIEAPLKPSTPEDSRDDKVLDLTSQLNRLIEKWIREEPTQWMCLKRRWPKDAEPARPAAAGKK